MNKNVSISSFIYPGIVVLYLALQLLFLDKLPDIMEDEPWYANTAYNFSQGNGFTNTNVGHQGGDFFILYTFFLGIAIKVFGCTLYVTRMVSVVAGLIALWGMISLLKTLKVSKLISSLTLLMFVLSNVTFVVFRTTRPESWILAFGIWSVFYLVKLHGRYRVDTLVLASLFATLSFLSHPNGILFLFVSGVYVLINAIQEKKPSRVIWFGLIALGLIVIHFTITFLNPNVSFKNFIVDIKDRNSVTNTYNGFFDNIVDSYHTYTLGIKRLMILLFEIGVLIFGIVLSKKGNLLRYFSIFGILVLILSLLIFNPYGTRHFGEILVFSFITFALAAEEIRNPKIRRLLVVVGCLYLLNNLAGDAYLVYSKAYNTPYSDIENKLSESIPEGSVVLTSQHFWYPLKNTEFYSEYTHWDFINSYENIDVLILSRNVDYVIHSSSFLKGITGTSGRSEDIPSSTLDFFHKAAQYADEQGKLKDKIPTVGFDTILIYKMN